MQVNISQWASGWIACLLPDFLFLPGIKSCSLIISEEERKEVHQDNLHSAVQEEGDRSGAETWEIRLDQLCKLFSMPAFLFPISLCKIPPLFNYLCNTTCLKVNTFYGWNKWKNRYRKCWVLLYLYNHQLLPICLWSKLNIGQQSHFFIFSLFVDTA